MTGRKTSGDSSAAAGRPGLGTWLLAGWWRVLLFGLLWAALSAAVADYAWYGVFSVAAAVALSLWLSPPRRGVPVRRWPRRLVAAVRLALWFAVSSVHGGVDVALRAVRWRVGIAPEVVCAPVELPAGGGRQLALLMMNLMPGTMVQRVLEDGGPQDHRVELHTLSVSLKPAQQWHKLQQLIAPVFDRG